jgi:hypothetical protein
MNGHTTLAAVVVFLLLAVPLASGAQPPARVFRVGILTLGLAPSAPPVEAFRQGVVLSGRLAPTGNVDPSRFGAE